MSIMFFAVLLSIVALGLLVGALIYKYRWNPLVAVFVTMFALGYVISTLGILVASPIGVIPIALFCIGALAGYRVAGRLLGRPRFRKRH